MATAATTAVNAISAPAAGADTGATTLELIRLFVLLVGVAALVTLLARRINLPYTVALVAFGIVAGAVFSPLRVEITPQLVLVVLLPALIFEASYQIDFGKLRPSLLGVSLLAGPGVLASAGLVALFLHLGAGLPPDEAFVVGAMLAATDPAAVIATFKRLASPRRLSTLVEAESLFNDGTGIVAFTIAVSFVTSSTSPTPLDTGLTFVSVVAVSAAIGAVTGWAASRVLPNVGDHLIEISLSVVLAYGTYLAADAVHQSGVIATSVAGIVGQLRPAPRALRENGRGARHRLGVRRLPGHGVRFPGGRVRDLAAVAGGRGGPDRLGRRGDLRGPRDHRLRFPGSAPADAAAVHEPASDGPSARVRGRRGRDEGDLPVGWLHVIYWSGLRGAVSTALALSLPADLPNRSMLQGITFGVVLFTLLTQATTPKVMPGAGRRLGSPPGSDRASAVETGAAQARPVDDVQPADRQLPSSALSSAELASPRPPDSWRAPRHAEQPEEPVDDDRAATSAPRPPRRSGPPRPPVSRRRSRSRPPGRRRPWPGRRRIPRPCPAPLASAVRARGAGRSCPARAGHGRGDDPGLWMRRQPGTCRRPGRPTG